MVVLGKTGSVVGLLTFGTMTSLFSKIGAHRASSAATRLKGTFVRHV